jgi:hypothetical protein
MRKIIEKLDYKLMLAFWQLARFHFTVEEHFANNAKNYDRAFAALQGRWEAEKRIYLLHVNNGVRP